MKSVYLTSLEHLKQVLFTKLLDLTPIVDPMINSETHDNLDIIYNFAEDTPSFVRIIVTTDCKDNFVVTIKDADELLPVMPLTESNITSLAAYIFKARTIVECSPEIVTSTQLEKVLFGQLIDKSPNLTFNFVKEDNITKIKYKFEQPYDSTTNIEIQQHNKTFVVVVGEDRAVFTPICEYDVRKIAHNIFLNRIKTPSIFVSNQLTTISPIFNMLDSLLNQYYPSTHKLKNLHETADAVFLINIPRNVKIKVFAKTIEKYTYEVSTEIDHTTFIVQYPADIKPIALHIINHVKIKPISSVDQTVTAFHKMMMTINPSTTITYSPRDDSLFHRLVHNGSHEQLNVQFISQQTNPVDTQVIIRKNINDQHPTIVFNNTKFRIFDEHDIYNIAQHIFQYCTKHESMEYNVSPNQAANILGEELNKILPTKYVTKPNIFTHKIESNYVIGLPAKDVTVYFEYNHPSKTIEVFVDKKYVVFTPSNKEDIIVIAGYIIDRYITPPPPPKRLINEDLIKPTSPLQSTSPASNVLGEELNKLLPTTFERKLNKNETDTSTTYSIGVPPQQVTVNFDYSTPNITIECENNTLFNPTHRQDITTIAKYIVNNFVTKNVQLKNVARKISYRLTSTIIHNVTAKIIEHSNTHLICNLNFVYNNITRYIQIKLVIQINNQEENYVLAALPPSKIQFSTKTDEDIKDLTQYILDKIDMQDHKDKGKL